jgi:hypothetical protein
VLDRVLSFTCDRGAEATADEVALFEYPQIWLRLLDELVDGSCPENPTDNRCGLERLLLYRSEQIDSRRDDRLHGIGNGEV